MMETQYFTFPFPLGTKFLPKEVQIGYEVLPGNVAVIETEDKQLIALLEKTQHIQRSSSDAIRKLIGKRKMVEELDRIPSFLKQTDWDCGFFNLPEPKGTCFFNPGLEWWDGSLHLFTRRNQYVRHPGIGSMVSTENDLAVFRLMPDLSVQSGTVPTPPKRYPGEQWEDPRAFVAHNELYVSMATWVPKMRWRIRQCLVVVDSDLSRFNVSCEPPFGGNHQTPPLATSHEKNWTWFVKKGAIHCLYSLHPIVIYNLAGHGDKLVATESPDTLPWQHGTLRGGTNPEPISNNEWLVFFHSSLPWVDAFGRCVMGTRRRYYMGALTFKCGPKFRITSITPKPLLTGSESDQRTLEGPPVVFPCGSKLIDGKWLVSLGINDEQCGWIRIPHEELKEIMVPIK